MFGYITPFPVIKGVESGFFCPVFMSCEFMQELFHVMTWAREPYYLSVYTRYINLLSSDGRLDGCKCALGKFFPPNVIKSG